MINARRMLGAALLLCGAGLAHAQQAEVGRIEGRVANAGRGIGGVSVQVLQTETIVFSDGEGRFVLDGLAPGNYTLLLKLGQDELARIAPVKAGETTKLDIEVDWTVRGYEKVKVTAGAERAEKIVDAPAAITALPAEEIEQEAAHGQLPKVLEYTPGAEVTQSGLYDFNFNTRGFNSSLNRRVSTYIDGRDIGVPLLGAQEWAALSIPLDDLESLEFIRGPSAALYGANASSGVVKMTTKAPRDSQGGMFRVTAGELDTLSGELRWADQLTKGMFYKVIAGSRDTGDFTVSRDPCPGFDGLSCPSNDRIVFQPEYSRFCRRVGETDCLQRERTLPRENDVEIQFGSLRLDKYLNDGSLLTFEGGSTHVEGPVFQTGIGRVQIVETDRPWARFAYAHPRFNVLTHWANRDGNQINMAKGLRADFELLTDTVRYGIEAQTNWKFFRDKMRFVIGVAHTKERIDSSDPLTGRQTVVFEGLESDRQAIFSQLDYKFNEKVKVVFAGRVDRNTLHDTQFSPKAALVYSMTPAHSVRFTFNEAFQVANYSEFFLHTRLTTFPLLGFAQTICRQAMQLGTMTPSGEPVGSMDGSCLGVTDNVPILAVGNDDLELEQTRSWEVGYSAILARKAFLTADYYSSVNRDFITDLMPQIGTSLGSPINTDYPQWVGPDAAEQAVLFQTPTGPLTVAQALRNTVLSSVGRLPFGMQLAQDLDGSSVVVGRTYANVGKVDTQGVDLGLNLFLTDMWNLQVSYSWFDFDIAGSAPDVNDILLPNSPEHKASMNVRFRKGPLDAGLGARWVDDFRWSAGVFQGDVEAYTTTDFSLNWAVHERVRLGLNVANLLDNVHRQTFGGDLLGRRALTNVTLFW